MSGRGKGKTAGKKSVSRSTKAGLQVGAIADHRTSSAAVCCAKVSAISKFDAFESSSLLFLSGWDLQIRADRLQPWTNSIAAAFLTCLEKFADLGRRCLISSQHVENSS